MTGPAARGGGLEDLLRGAAPRALAAVVRRFGDFADAEDAVQEALIEAARRWPTQGTPENPTGWLIAVASRRMTDKIRADSARRAREERIAAEPEAGPAAEADDTLALIFMCCRPELTPASAVALTLRAVGGLTTAEIAAAFLVPETTMGRRIARAKKTVAAAAEPFGLPAPAERKERLGAVLRVLYLIFNEGYAASEGPELARAELSAEAIRLTRIARLALPEEPEVGGLLALMLLTDARRPARTDADGELVPLDEQDRSRWDAAAIAAGHRMLNEAVAMGAVGPYQLQAAIAAAHDRARRPEDTDWGEILALYGLLERVAPGPMVALNRAVAMAMAEGPQAGLALLVELEPQLEGHHRVHAVRAHLFELAGDVPGAHVEYTRAAELTASLPEQRYLTRRAARLAGGA
ncbi:MAG TPA: sigma-70 family RNA polymerase sigma factor [Solirubrobacterales bacterium]|nr:sigma-70 family RNA polymerase sigma factor [Solirubrobacterales bacterium]